MKAIVLLVCLFSLNLKAVTNVVLKEVRGNSTKSISVDPANSPVLILFGENCSFCKAQVKELACLKQSKIEYLNIMLMRDEKAAFKEKQRINLKDKLYLSNNKFEETFQIKKKITPTIIIPNGKKFSVVYGKKSCDEIKNYGKN
jgi:hypothetical protein